MEPEKPSNERLVALEVKMEMLLELLKEIRDDLKDQPSREEFDNHVTNNREQLKEVDLRISKLEQAHLALALKVGSVAGLLGFISALIVNVILKK